MINVWMAVQGKTGCHETAIAPEKYHKGSPYLFFHMHMIHHLHTKKTLAGNLSRNIHTSGIVQTVTIPQITNGGG